MIRAIVTDIEGTTSSLSFVKDVLFPYARRHIAEYVRAHATDERVAPLLDDVRELMAEPAGLDAIIDQLIEWIDGDRKITPLKTLQGLVWEHGYRAGDFHGHIYDDAVTMLRRWQQQGIELYVYSSGSVYAQELLFAHTRHGDVRSLFTGYFDTHIGPKNEAASYRRIAAELAIAAHDIVFLSDINTELDAASAAGMRTVQLVRDGLRDDHAEHPRAGDFFAVATLLEEWSAVDQAL